MSTKERIPPGYYTPQTLPPLSDEARKILASVDAGVGRLSAEGRSVGCCRIAIEEGGIGIQLSDEELPGLTMEDLDRLEARLKGEP